MKIEDYYLKLSTLLSSYSVQEFYLINMDHLSATFDCTKRNAQLILAKMKKEKMIEWYPGQGRGNQSRIKLLLPYKKIIVEMAIKMVQASKMKEAWEIINQTNNDSVKSSFTSWYYQNFGLKQEDHDQDLLRIPLYKPISSLDPAFPNRKTRTELNIMKQIFDTLVVYSPSDHSILPHLAHYWEYNDDAKRWTFYIRKGVHFHDGKLLTAKDVKYTLERLLALKAINNDLMKIKSIESTGQYIVHIVLYERNPLLLNYLCLVNYSIVPSNSSSDFIRDSFFHSPVGTGPFLIKENNESMSSLLAHDYYFLGRPLLDRIELWISELNKEPHVTKLSDSTNDNKPDQGVEINQIEKGSCYLSINLTKNGLLDDLMLRKALLYGLDRSHFIRDSNYGKKVLTNGFLSASHALKDSIYDRQLAKQFLKKSTYQGEFLTLYTSDFPLNIEDAYNIKEEYFKIGIQILIHILPIKDFLEPSQINKADLILFREVLGNQADISLIEMYMNPNGIILNHLSNENRNIREKIINKCITTSNEDRVHSLIELESKLVNSINIIFLYQRVQYIQHASYIGGVNVDEYGKIDLSKIWIKRT